MLDPRHIAALSAILQTGSFDAAAQVLGVTQSAISQRLRALEDQVGAVLVVRGTPCVGTETGRRIAAHADHVGLLEAQLAKDIASLRPGPGPRARISLAVNADSLATWFLSALAEVDGVLFDIVVDDQEFSANWLRRGEVAAAVTAQPDPVSGCDIRPLGTLRYHATASPDYMVRWFPDGVSAAALRRAPALHFDEKDYLQSRWIKTHVGGNISPPTHGLPSSQGFVEACLLGLGWGMNPQALVADHIDAGRLVPLIDATPLDVPLYWQSSRLMRDVLEPLGKAVRKAAKAALIPA